MFHKVNICCLLFHIFSITLYSSGKTPASKVSLMFNFWHTFQWWGYIHWSMIKIHCNQLTDFLRIYVFDWHVLCVLLIPFLFAVFFPVYWFVLCPGIWKTDLSLYKPRSWLIGYWLTAALIWYVQKYKAFKPCFIMQHNWLFKLFNKNLLPNSMQYFSTLPLSTFPT